MYYQLAIALCQLRKSCNSLQENLSSQLVITIGGIDLERFLGDKEIQAAVLLLLQKASGDTSLKFEKFEEGSIKITLSGSPEGLERLAALIQSRELSKVLGYPIEDAKFVLENMGEDDTNLASENKEADDNNVVSSPESAYESDTNLKQQQTQQNSYFKQENSDTYINHPTWGLLYRICMVDETRDLFTTLYAQRLFFLVTNDIKDIKFQPIGRTEARMMLENRLRTLRRTEHSQEYDQLQSVFQRTFQ